MRGQLGLMIFQGVRHVQSDDAIVADVVFGFAPLKKPRRYIANSADLPFFLICDQLLQLLLPVLWFSSPDHAGI